MFAIDFLEYAIQVSLKNTSLSTRKVKKKIFENHVTAVMEMRFKNVYHHYLKSYFEKIT